MIAILTVVLASVLSVLVGVPWAALLRRATDDVADLLSDALGIGLMFVVTTLSVYSWVGVPGLTACLLLEGGVVALLVRRRLPLVVLTWPSRGAVLWAVAFGVILLAVVVLRRHPSDFVAYTGDMGAYPSWANQFIRTGSLSATWPPAFSMLLVLGGWLAGSAGGTAIVPITGLALVIAIVRLLRLVGVDRWVALLVATVIAVHPAAVWFSRLTLSESLNAPFVVVWLIALTGALRNGGSRRLLIGWSVVGGLTMLALSLLRGTAPLLLVPLLVLAVAAVVVARGRSLRLFLAACGIGAVVGFWYGIDRITHYYVDLQLREILPAGLFETLRGRRLLEVSPESAVLAGGAIALLLLAAALGGRANRRGGRIPEPSPGDVGRAVRLLEAISGLALVAAVAHSAALDTDVWQILGRFGLGVVVVALAAPFALALTRHGPVRAVVVIVASLLASLFVELQIVRLPEPRPHIVHLYWDRYLFSEVFPLLMVLAGLTLHALLEGARAIRAAEVRRVAVRATWVALPTATAAVVAGILPDLALVDRQTLLQGARPIQTALGAAMPDRDRTVVWGTSAEGEVSGSGFPNTWQAFGVPLAFERGYRFDNAGRSTADGALPDAVLTSVDLARAASCSRAASLYVVESELPGGAPLPDRIDPAEFRVQRLAAIEQDVVQLPQPAPEGWTSARYSFEVFRVSVVDAPAAPPRGGCSYRSSF